MKPVYFFISSLIFVLTTTASHAQKCAPNAPFDDYVDYPTILYVSTDGDDSNPGTGEAPFRTLQRALQDVEPGTEILLSSGIHEGVHASNIQGTETQPIRINGKFNGEPTVIKGGNSALQFSDPAYLVLENLTIEGASQNGLNIDDGGDYSTPAHHVILRNITVRDVGSDGNQDGIKLSGLDHFMIDNCTVDNAGDGGSAIDMVGCHDGVITHCQFNNTGVTGIQAKGGSARVLIHANRFEGGAGRAVNMGGSTGLPYFRPDDAPYEASHITVWGNLFIGPQTPVAFTGCQYGLFAHNTVIRPTNWIARILQESVDERFVPSSNNVYANNIVVIDNAVNTLVNIGGNTAPDTFRFMGNLIFDEDDANFSNPNLPGEVSNNLIQQDPMFDEQSEAYALLENSPARHAGVNLADAVDGLQIDIPNSSGIEGGCFEAAQPTIGAHAAYINEVKGWRAN